MRAAAARIQADAPSEADRAALAALRGDALRTFGHSASEFVCMLSEVLDNDSAELREEAARYAESMGLS